MPADSTRISLPPAEKLRAATSQRGPQSRPGVGRKVLLGALLTVSLLRRRCQSSWGKLRLGSLAAMARESYAARCKT